MKIREIHCGNSLKTDYERSKRKVELSSADYEKAELNLLREAMKHSYKERFLMATRLYKIQQTMKKAVITHKAYMSR